MSTDSERLIDEVAGILGFDETLQSGWPDRLVRRSDGSLAFVEIKKGHEPLNPRQKQMAGRLRELGIDYFVIRVFRLTHADREVLSDASDVIKPARVVRVPEKDHTRVNAIREMLRLGGKSLTEIARSVVPPVSRQRVHQIKMSMEAEAFVRDRTPRLSETAHRLSESAPPSFDSERPKEEL